MTYVLPKELSLKYNVSLKTVYNYLSKESIKIRTNKQYWKTFVNETDFEEYFTKDIQSLQNHTNTINENGLKYDVWILKNDFETLQKNYTTLSQQKTDLQNYNLALQEQVSKYALLLVEEKNEKKELTNKYDALQKEYHENIIQHGEEKAKSAKNFYLMVGISVMLAIVVLLLFLLQYKAIFKGVL